MYFLIGCLLQEALNMRVDTKIVEKNTIEAISSFHSNNNTKEIKHVY